MKISLNSKKDKCTFTATEFNNQEMLLIKTLIVSSTQISELGFSTMSLKMSIVTLLILMLTCQPISLKTSLLMTMILVMTPITLAKGSKEL